MRTYSLRRRSPAQEPRDEALLFLAPHVDQAELPERLDALRLDLHGTGEHLHRDVGAADRMADAAHEEVGLLAIPRQLDPALQVDQRLRRPLAIVGSADVERPAQAGGVLPLVRVELDRLLEAPEGLVVLALAKRRLPLLELELGLDGATAFVELGRLAART